MKLVFIFKAGVPVYTKHIYEYIYIMNLKQPLRYVYNELLSPYLPCYRSEKNAVLAILISVLRVVSDHCLVGIERESVFVIVRYFSLYLNNKSCFKTLKC